MSVILFLAFFFIALLIIGMVLLQEGKGGGLAGSSTSMDGVLGAKNPLRRWTAYFFAMFIVLAVGINWYFHNRDVVYIPEAIIPATVASDNVSETTLEPEYTASDESPVVSPEPATDTPAPATDGTTKATKKKPAAEAPKEVDESGDNSNSPYMKD